MTAEFAAALPAVLVVLAFCLGAVQVMGQQVRMSDAAADVARLLARGDGAGPAAGLLIVILRGDEVRGILTDLVRSALTVG